MLKGQPFPLSSYLPSHSIRALIHTSPTTKIVQVNYLINKYVIEDINFYNILMIEAAEADLFLHCGRCEARSWKAQRHQKCRIRIQISLDRVLVAIKRRVIFTDDANRTLTLSPARIMSRTKRWQRITYTDE